jgi:hypothetical protein
MRIVPGGITELAGAVCSLLGLQDRIPCDESQGTMRQSFSRHTKMFAIEAHAKPAYLLRSARQQETGGID